MRRGRREEGGKEGVAVSGKGMVQNKGKIMEGEERERRRERRGDDGVGGKRGGGY